jgi:hypothetical protein
MHRVTPKIFNGDLQLIVSETLCCNPKFGVQIYLPVTVGRSIKIAFVFNENVDKSKKNCDISQDNEGLSISMDNFLAPHGASLSKPLGFAIGEDKFLIQLYGCSTADDCLCLTVSIFYKGKNE